MVSLGWFELTRLGSTVAATRIVTEQDFLLFRTFFVHLEAPYALGHLRRTVTLIYPDGAQNGAQRIQEILISDLVDAR